MSLPLAPCSEQLSQRDGKAKSGEQSQGWGWHLQGRIGSAKPTSNGSRSQEPPPVDFLSSDPWSEHSPGSTSICTASYSTFCSIPKCRKNNQHREMVSQPELLSHPNSCLCKLSAIPDCHHSLQPTEVLHNSGRKVLLYLPTISCSALPCHVRAGRHKPHLPPVP